MRDDELRHLIKMMKNSSDFYFIDIGAYQGVYSWWAKRSGNCKRVKMIEANKYNYLLLKEFFLVDNIYEIENKACNGNGNNCQFNIPLVKVDFSNNGKTNGLGSIKTSFNTAQENIEYETIEVNGTTLDEILQDNIIKYKTVFIKIDVEGIEYNIVESVNWESYTNLRIIIFIEVDRKAEKKVKDIMNKNNIHCVFTGKMEDRTRNIIFERLVE